MIIEVEMHAFANGAIRRVEIPSEDKRLDPTNFDALCGLAFEYGQNDFQRQNMPSVSVGDIIRVPRGDTFRRVAVMPIGFKDVADDFIPPHDGGMWAYLESSSPSSGGDDVGDSSP